MVAEAQTQTADPHSFPNYITAEMNMDDQMIAHMIQAVDTSPEEGTIAASAEEEGRFTSDRALRRSQVFRVPAENEWVGVYQGFGQFIEQINAQVFGFNLEGIEALQIARYQAGELGHYGWHTDSAYPNNRRKLSISVQLSNSEDYEGGDLEFMFRDPPVKASRQKRHAIVFPSYAVHRVTPVTKGTRYSLVAWIRGERWR